VSTGRTTTLTRPVPAQAARLLDRFGDDVHEIIVGLRERIFKVAPDVHEIITDVGYTVSLQYGPDDKVAKAFCYIAGFSNHANLGFQQGAMLPDRHHIMQGSGAKMRHVKFATFEQTQAAWLDSYLEAALAQKGLSSDIGDGQTTTRPRPARARAGRNDLAR
jgi:Domain of unknown function (DU1801)